MKYLLFMAGLLIFLIACTGIPGAECKTDADCVTSGCSGTLCQAKTAEPVFTTCEYLAEYDCYKEIDCGCVNYKCEWVKNPSFEQCLAEKRS